MICLTILNISNVIIYVQYQYACLQSILANVWYANEPVHISNVLSHSLITSIWNMTCITSHQSCKYCMPDRQWVLLPGTHDVSLFVPDVCWFPQVEADDVLTKEEQMYLLINARNKCESSIKSRHKTAGEKWKCIQTKLNAFQTCGYVLNGSRLTP